MNRKVAIYARVSTEHEAQLSALDNQVQYYDEILEKHPNWILYDRYIDEGITGTSIKKRKNFIRMMKDAHGGKFDLIITREVSRFARNTVDTLQETRKLKKIGVEVYFTEDNIWTFKDDDGELKLTIMATLAQNESKKTSQRVKAGLKIAFQNGIFMGSGNILGIVCITDKETDLNYDYSELRKVNARYEFTIDNYIMGLIEEVKNAEFAYIANVCVDPNYRDLHVGTFLLDNLIKEYKIKKFNEIVLDVLADNPRAIHLYQKMGFERLGDIFPGFNNPEGEKTDVFTMKNKI